MSEYFIDSRVEKLHNGNLRVFRVYNKHRQLVSERVIAAMPEGDRFVDVCINPNDDGFPEVYPKSYIDYQKAYRMAEHNEKEEP